MLLAGPKGLLKFSLDSWLNLRKQCLKLSSGLPLVSMKDIGRLLAVRIKAVMSYKMRLDSVPRGRVEV